MKNVLGRIALYALLATFSFWQMSRANDAVADGIRKQVRLDVQAETITTLEKLGERIDKALEARGKENEKIVQKREQARKNTRDAAHKDSALQEQLATRLHPALRPHGGLLGGAPLRKNGRFFDGSDGASKSHGGP